tara:strand:- start:316 stop:648 length:333 start_codon:yes stop_codon:yes gene_type:complete
MFRTVKITKWSVFDGGEPKKHATGTSFAPGGLSLVGERGPEMVSLPRGSGVSTAPQTSNAMSTQNDLISKLINKIDNISGGDGKPIEINLVVDGRKLASVVHNNTEYLTI